MLYIQICTELSFKRMFNIWINLLKKLKSAKVDGCESSDFLQKESKVV
jgi:hypothetical protein